jgi:hypothetical protein
MDGVSLKLKKPFWYELQTRNEKMRDWAREKGDGIFHWESTEEGHDTSGIGDKTKKNYIFTTTISPE